MKLIQRLKNLYRLSEIEISPEKKEKITNLIKENPRMAIIIHRKTAIDKFLEEKNDISSL